MGEHQRLARGQIRCDRLVVDLLLLHVRYQDHDHVSLLGDFRHLSYLEASFFSLGPGVAAFVQTHHDILAAVFQVQCVGMALASVAHNADNLVFQNS